MTARALRAGLAMGVLLACVPGAAAAAPPPPNTVSRWDEIAQNTVVSSGAFQNEGLVYMAYVAAPCSLGRERSLAFRFQRG
jgi:hypothetical protein